MDIVDFATLTDEQRAQAARVLSAAFAPIGAYQGQAAEAEVATFVEDPDRFALAALEDGAVVGFVGGVDGYPKALELHPLVVDPPHQGQGVGSALLVALETRASTMGKLTVYLGSDDEIGGTSLFGADVYPDPLSALAAIAPTSGHPFFFYRRHGYVPVGLIPDANGYGKPDLLLAKRVARP